MVIGIWEARVRGWVPLPHSVLTMCWTQWQAFFLTKTQSIQAGQSHRTGGSDYSVSNKYIWNTEAETRSSVQRGLVVYVEGADVLSDRLFSYHTWLQHHQCLCGWRVSLPLGKREKGRPFDFLWKHNPKFYRTFPLPFCQSMCTWPHLVAEKAKKCRNLEVIF